jgi:hypothetical protein
MAAASSGVGPAALWSFCLSWVDILKAVVDFAVRKYRDPRVVMSDPGADVAAGHEQQKARITAHRSISPEIPGDYACAGDCSHPPPAPPAGSTVEVFQSGSGHEKAWVSVVGVAAAVFVAVCLFQRSR